MLLIILALLCQFYIYEIEAKASVVGCVTNKQAETIFEEISKMFDNVALFDTIDGLFKNEVSEKSLAAIKRCDPGFEDKYNTKTQSVVAFALQAENDVKEANGNRIKQVEVGRVFEDTWKKMQKLFRLHEKTFYAFDIYLKDSLMQTSARIGQDIRSGNKGEIKWDNVLMFDSLWNETKYAQYTIFRMPEGMFKVMKSVLKQMLQANIASQFYAAVNNSDWEAVYRLYYQKYSQMSEHYSELTLSKYLRHSAKLKYDTMVVGVEEGEEYAKKTNVTLEKVRAAVEKLNSASVYNSCDKNEQIGAETINELTALATSLEENEVKFAAEYLDKIYKFYRYSFKPVISTYELEDAMKVIKDTLPEIRNPKLEETHKFLQEFAKTAMINGVTSMDNHWFMFLNKTEETMNIMVEYAECHANIIQVFNNIVQDCKDGKGSFDEIYQRRTTSITFDKQECLETSMLELAPKEEIKASVKKIVELFSFNADCTKNRPNDDVLHSSYEDDTDNDDEDDDVLSPSQRFTVCDLKNKHGLTENAIAEKIQMPLAQIRKLRCPNSQERDKQFDYIRNLQPLVGYPKPSLVESN